MGNGRLISYVRIFTDDELNARTVLPFTDLGKAEDFVRELNSARDDGGLDGISKVELDFAVPTDDWAVSQFWADVFMGLS